MRWFAVGGLRYRVDEANGENFFLPPPPHPKKKTRKEKERKEEGLTARICEGKEARDLYVEVHTPATPTPTPHTHRGQGVLN